MYDTRHQIVREAGASGTVTLPPGAQVLKIRAHATGAGTVAMPDGKGGTATMPLPASSQWFEYEAFHLEFKKSGTVNTIVFTGTDAYLVEYTAPTGV